MRNALKSGRARDAILHFGRETVRDFNDLRAGSANQMVMVIMVVRDEFEARGAIPKIEAMDHPHLFKQMH